jgi:uncharacterized protein (DUF1778 family)
VRLAAINSAARYGVGGTALCNSEKTKKWRLSGTLFAVTSCGNLPYMCYYSFAERVKEVMATARTKRERVRAARLDIRLNPQAKEKIEQAAVVSHQSLTDFVVTNLLRASEEALERQRIIHLSNRDRDLFLTALEANAHPNRALRKAAERFKRSNY